LDGSKGEEVVASKPRSGHERTKACIRQSPIRKASVMWLSVKERSIMSTIPRERSAAKFYYCVLLAKL
jgi:hypothetical protein